MLRIYRLSRFAKADAVITIKYSEDLVFNGYHDWLEDKKILTKVKKIKDEWSKQHEELVKIGVQTSDVRALKRAEKLTKVMCDLRCMEVHVQLQKMWTNLVQLTRMTIKSCSAT